MLACFHGCILYQWSTIMSRQLTLSLWQWVQPAISSWIQKVLCCTKSSHTGIQKKDWMSRTINPEALRESVEHYSSHSKNGTQNQCCLTFIQMWTLTLSSLTAVKMAHPPPQIAESADFWPHTSIFMSTSLSQTSSMESHILVHIYVESIMWF